MRATARAYTNIALIKYWGKRNDSLFLPMNSSLSLTLDKFYTTTTVEFCENLTADVFILNNQLASDQELTKVSHFLDLVRKEAGKAGHAIINSTNHVPTAAGFASSASGFAALAAASAKALGLQVNDEGLSRLARQGSGSACRSIYGGFVEWNKGDREDGLDSFAQPIHSDQNWDLTVLSIQVSSDAKSITSREGMKRTVETSPFYSGWLDGVERDFYEAKMAIQKHDFDMLGQVMEANALKMHATTLGAKPPFTYWRSATLEVMQRVQELRAQGISAYFTIDAGPNVKVLCQTNHEQAVYQAIAALPSVQEIYLCHPGPGISYVTKESTRAHCEKK